MGSNPIGAILRTKLDVYINDMWKLGDMFVLETESGGSIIGRIVSRGFRKYWNVELLVLSRLSPPPYVILGLDFSRRKIKKIVGEEAEFYELFWEKIHD